MKFWKEMIVKVQKWNLKSSQKLIDFMILFRQLGRRSILWY